MKSTRYVFGVHENSLIVNGVGVFGDGGQLNVVLLFGDFWVHQKIELVVSVIVISSIVRLVQVLLPQVRRILGGVNYIVFGLLDWLAI